MNIDFDRFIWKSMCELSAKIEKSRSHPRILRGLYSFEFCVSQILLLFQWSRGSRNSKKFSYKIIYSSRTYMPWILIFDFGHLVALESKWKFSLKFSRTPPGGGHITCYTSFERLDELIPNMYISWPVRGHTRSTVGQTVKLGSNRAK